MDSKAEKIASILSVDFFAVCHRHLQVSRPLSDTQTQKLEGFAWSTIIKPARSVPRPYSSGNSSRYGFTLSDLSPNSYQNLRKTLLGFVDWASYAGRTAFVLSTTSPQQSSLMVEATKEPGNNSLYRVSASWRSLPLEVYVGTMIQRYTGAAMRPGRSLDQLPPLAVRHHTNRKDLLMPNQASQISSTGSLCSFPPAALYLLKNCLPGVTLKMQ